MERKVDRKTLSFSKGITNIPSDLLSEDSELAECKGFIYKDGEMKPIQNPALIGNVPYKVVYVHKNVDYENIIAYDGVSRIYCYSRTKDGKIDLGSVSSFEVGSVSDANSVGNTLVLATTDGLHYLLFKAGKYINLGTDLPTPKVEFNLMSSNVWPGGGTYCELYSFFENNDDDIVGRFIHFDSNGNISSIDNDDSFDNDGYQTRLIERKMPSDYDKLQGIQTAIQGHVSQRIQLLKEKKRFLFPFFLRFALKLYDGSYARISNPIACFPSITKNCNMRYIDDGFVRSNTLSATADLLKRWYYEYNPLFSQLYYKASIDDMGNWSDIVKEIVVFASDDVMPFYLEKDWSFKIPTEVVGKYYYTFIGADDNTTTDFGDIRPIYKYSRSSDANNKIKSYWPVIEPTYKTTNGIIEELINKTQFYKLFRIKASDGTLGSINFTEAPIADGVVENLTVQEQLKVDDYYGWTKTSASKIFSYNKRLNVMDIKRIPFKGFTYFTANSTYGFPSSTSYTYYVHIVNGSFDVWVKTDDSYGQHIYSTINGWLYYPDPNATEMLIVKTGTTKGWKITLSIHPMLNGAYSLERLPFPSLTESESGMTDIDIPEVSAECEVLNSNIYTSEVNNPFVFNASGDNAIGTGRVIGVSANTEAVSQGQFGQYPLIVFTSEGIYGMSVSSTGTYSAAYPVSREVCLDNSPFIPTDKLVFFISQKGLMAISGSMVACMSEQLRGRNPRSFTGADRDFMDFMSNCMIAYDYRDSVLRLYNREKTYQYIYNMLDKTFSMVDNKNGINSIVNDYPDNLIQDTSGNVYSLIGKPDVNNDGDVYNGSLITRPLKLGGSIALKSLRSIKHLLDTDTGKVSIEVYGSNDCKHWQKIVSLGGKPWKYFVFKYTLRDFKATDSFVGSIVETQARREDKIR